MGSKKLKVAVLFGGRSTEHEISIITGLQVLNNIDKSKFDPMPVYVSKKGEWFMPMEQALPIGGDKLFQVETYKDLDSLGKFAQGGFIVPDTSFNGVVRAPKGLSVFNKLAVKKVDVVFPCFHGSFGEDGSVMGLLEMAGIPYVGCGILSSSLAMDKILAKSVFRDLGIPVVKDYWFLRERWSKDQKKIIAGLESNLQYPLFVKPANSGSTIGVGFAKNKVNLIKAVDVARFYDRRVLVEEAVKDAKEVNISVMGYQTLAVSECEQPISSKEFLTFEDKYTRGGGKSQGMASSKRVIPAPIKSTTKKKIEEYAKLAFRGLDCSGLVRIDFLLSKDEIEIYINEVNTLPGSISFYLWEPKGITFKELISRLIELGLARHKDREKTVRTFNTNVLENFSGIKGPNKNT